MFHVIRRSSLCRLRYFIAHTRPYAQKSREVDPDDQPIKYSTSPASKLRASFKGGVEVARPWYESYVILASVAVFMVYFTMLREESDIDIEFSKSLYSRIDGLEEQQLRQLLEYSRSRGGDTRQIVERLREIEKERGMT